MKSTKILIGALLILIFGIVTLSKASEQPEMKIIYLKDGTVVKGQIVSSDETSVKVRTSFGEITISRGDIREIKYVDETQAKAAKAGDITQIEKQKRSGERELELGLWSGTLTQFTKGGNRTGYLMGLTTSLQFIPQISLMLYLPFMNASESRSSGNSTYSWHMWPATVDLVFKRRFTENQSLFGGVGIGHYLYSYTYDYSSTGRYSYYYVNEKGKAEMLGWQAILGFIFIGESGTLTLSLTRFSASGPNKIIEFDSNLREPSDEMEERDGIILRLNYNFRIIRRAKKW